jgi:hypothetical protein
MTDKLIIVGDSFCMEKRLWPATLARKLKLDLIHRSFPGAHWWPAADFLLKVSPEVRDSTQVLIIAHTNSDRLPSSDESLFRPNLIDTPETEQDTAIVLYKKYIEDLDFLYWAHKQWILEIEQNWSHAKIIHLNCYPWTVNLPFSGVSVVPPLINLSLNELGPDATFNATAENETRKNHFNTYNNIILSDELKRIIDNYAPGQQSLDVSKFEQQTDKWIDWEWKKLKTSYLDKK